MSCSGYQTMPVPLTVPCACESRSMQRLHGQIVPPHGLTAPHGDAAHTQSHPRPLTRRPPFTPPWPAAQVIHPSAPAGVLSSLSRGGGGVQLHPSAPQPSISSLALLGAVLRSAAAALPSDGAQSRQLPPDSPLLSSRRPPTDN